MWYFKIIGGRLANVTLRFIPLVVVTSLLPDPFHFGLPASGLHFLLFLLSLSMGTLLVTALTVLYPIITLTTMIEKGVVNIIITIGDILSGLVIPIPFFPNFLKIISQCLPFQYISDLPFRIYVGNISISNGIIGVILQVFWTIIVIMIGKLLLNKNIRRVVVQGG